MTVQSVCKPMVALHAPRAVASMHGVISMLALADPKRVRSTYGMSSPRVYCVNTVVTYHVVVIYHVVVTYRVVVTYHLSCRHQYQATPPLCASPLIGCIGLQPTTARTATDQLLPSQLQCSCRGDAGAERTSPLEVLNGVQGGARCAVQGGGGQFTRVFLQHFKLFF